MTLKWPFGSGWGPWSVRKREYCNLWFLVSVRPKALFHVPGAHYVTVPWGGGALRSPSRQLFLPLRPEIQKIKPKIPGPADSWICVAHFLCNKDRRCEWINCTNVEQITATWTGHVMWIIVYSKYRKYPRKMAPTYNAHPNF